MGPNWVVFITDLLRKVGMPERLLPYLIAQVAHETDGGRSTLANTFHNWSGIKANNHGLTSGTTSGGFATYANDGKWASDYKRVLSMSPGRPIDATSAQDFYLRLLKNGYFTQKESAAYATAFNNRLREVNAILADKSGNLAVAVKTKKEIADQKATGPGALTLEDPTITEKEYKKKYPKSPEALDKGGFIKKHPLLAGAAAAVGLVIVIKALNN